MNSFMDQYSPEPLKDFSVIRTTDPAEARELMRRRFGVELITSDVAQFFARTNRARLPNVWMLFSANSAPVQLLIADPECAQAHLLLRGHCSLTTDHHPLDFDEGDAFICSPGHPAHLDFGPGAEELVFCVSPTMLTRTMASLTGFRPRVSLRFEPTIPSDDPRFLGFRDLLLLLAGRLDSRISVWPKAALAQLEQACITLLLHCSRHNYRRFLDVAPTDDVPACVRIAEAYVESHRDANVSINDLARAAHVSVSTLSRAFLRARGHSPSAFIKKVRLSRARRQLEDGGATTVVGVALRFGFANPSRFAQDYREAFGESPADTLRRSRLPPGGQVQKD